ncbi:MAG: hypothetical protein JSU01_16180 [Bacteroidetes bacterium]|nr:hypothetical protein [Bacteroidota bacterium]
MRKAKPFRSAKQLDELINAYFDSLKNNSEEENTESSAPPTFAGLLLFTGFTGREEFDEYAAMPRYSRMLLRANLRISEIYEKKLHESSTGAVFALKNMGWNERPEIRPADKETDHTLQVEIVQSGIRPVSSEKEVIL